MSLFHRNTCNRGSPTLRRLTTLAVFLSALSIAASAHAATYYVATTGSDSGAGATNSPFKTIAYAYSKANAGDTIIVKSGVYTEYKAGYGGLYLNKDGTASAPITIKSEVPGGAIIDVQGKAPLGLYMSGDYNIVEGFKITNAQEVAAGVYGKGNQIISTEMYHNGTNYDPTSSFGGGGIFTSKTSSNTVMSGNYIHNNGRAGSNLDHGLYLCGDNEVVTNNIVTNNAANGLQIAGYDTVSNMKVYNNIFAYNGKAGIILWQALAGIDIKNNILYSNQKAGIATYNATGSGVSLTNNIYYGNGSKNTFIMEGSGIVLSEPGAVQQDPLFVNPGSGDFGLQAGSPAIDTGVTLAQVPTDFTGKARPEGAAYDIGAFEGAGSKANVLPGVGAVLPGATGGAGAGGSSGTGSRFGGLSNCAR